MHVGILATLCRLGLSILVGLMSRPNYWCRTARYLDHIVAVAHDLPRWKNERLPPPRTNQSQYDKVGLTRECDRIFGNSVLMYHSFTVDVGCLPRLYCPFDVPLRYADVVSFNLGISKPRADGCEGLKSCACQS